ncbi:PHA/PHB synthase family protein [Pseudoblastomonas halimionae]|uniref:Class I poly(R)-hydroxyalkanoic acid synthase n=1 Tax=Alteriqipengyuania halimionae TaxID=1926630 RepID=A0A6I4U6P8_9SPHN|nr:class I poly(R)-hydroxyalkanoic acid synthase [Alteriqipengyuania halimionae]
MDGFAKLMQFQAEAARDMFGQFLPGAGAEPPKVPDINHWTELGGRVNAMWTDFLRHQTDKARDQAAAFDPAQFATLMQGWAKSLPTVDMKAQQKAWGEGLAIWDSVMKGFTGRGDEAGEASEMPKTDRRFADPAWRAHPAYALLHQMYLMLSEYWLSTVDSIDGLDREQRESLRFATRAMTDAMSPDHFLMTNPVVLEKTMATGGENLVKGLRNLIEDLKKGQLTHTDPDAFTLGENIATTPGKVIHQTDLYQLIQYSPSTDSVLEVPLVIFPPWINRFYILDLTAKKSFIKWAVDQGITVFVVSWKSADESMADVVWDDYIRAQIEAIDHVRERLGVPAVHTIGYCVAGTTLAATLAILARRGEADRVKSATFFTAQVDFEKSGELKNLIDDQQLETVAKLSPQGYLDGRYLAATFNMLRGKDLIWNYVLNNYLLGEDYPAFDLLHWNGDVTNLPAKWHGDYLRNLYRDNKLVVPDALRADGTPIDLTRIETPVYIQAGREDHIAPAESVWRFTRHLKGDTTFLLAGSGHIAGVINHPDAGKYQYWLGDSGADTFDDYVDGAEEHPGSWWPHWVEWLRAIDDAEVKPAGKRRPGGKGDKAIEDAPGSYVKTR